MPCPNGSRPATIFSRPSAKLLSNSHYYEILGGHAVSNLSCVQDMMVAFYADPYTRPVNPCSTTYEWDAAIDLSLYKGYTLGKPASRMATRGRLFPWH